MASLGFDGGFDSNQHEPSDFSPMPPGSYDAAIIDSEVKESASGEKYLKLTVQVLGGQYQNRKLWDILCLWHKNPEAAHIAKGKLSSICRAVGVAKANDSMELHDKPLQIVVGVKKDGSGEYDPKNIIKAYKPRHTQPTQPPASSGVKNPFGK